MGMPINAAYPRPAKKKCILPGILEQKEAGLLAAAAALTGWPKEICYLMCKKKEWKIDGEDFANLRSKSPELFVDLYYCLRTRHLSVYCTPNILVLYS